MPMIAARCPAAASQLEEELSKGVASESTSIVAASVALAKLQVEGYDAPNWRDLLRGQRPPPVERPEPGDFRHGWQYYASKAREEYHLKKHVVPASERPEQALLKSQAGRNCARALTAVPRQWKGRPKASDASY